MDGFLFEIDNENLGAVLSRNAERGTLFYSVSQCVRYLGLSECQVRYAIETYRLDALFLSGAYRIPYTAILRFSDSGWLELSIEYLNAHKAVDIEGVYDLNFNGEVGHIVRSLESKGMPLEAIPLLLHNRTRKEYDELPGEERNLQDWYGLDELEFPLEASAAEYSRLLRIKPEWLCWKLGRCDDKGYRVSEIIGYPELLDLLIECEMVNFPIPVVLDFSRPPVIEPDDGQLSFSFV